MVGDLVVLIRETASRSRSSRAIERLRQNKRALVIRASCLRRGFTDHILWRFEDHKAPGSKMGGHHRDSGSPLANDYIHLSHPRDT